MSVPAWFLHVLCLKPVVSSTTEFHLQDLEGSQEQWKQPILFWELPMQSTGVLSDSLWLSEARALLLHGAGLCVLGPRIMDGKNI